MDCLVDRRLAKLGPALEVVDPNGLRHRRAPTHGSEEA
jgi:hypothetical protein